MLSPFIRRLSTAASRKTVRTAGCIIIGDEILNAKILDTNSRFFAQTCYQHGISLEKITVVGDKEQDIINAVHEFDPKYDLTVTSGGVGSTHDDITYQAMANAYGLPLQLDSEVAERAQMLRARQGKKNVETGSTEWESYRRMMELPAAANGITVSKYFSPTSWTPVVVLNGKVCVMPGVPKFFEELVTEGLMPQISTPNDPYTSRYVVTKVTELSFGPYLSQLQDEVDPSIKLGSYPHYEQRVNTISITGRVSESEVLDALAAKVCKEVEGRVITKKQEADLSADRSTKEIDFLKDWVE